MKKYFVVLDPASLVGRIYAQEDSDGITNGCPYLRCTDVRTDLPYYLLASRESDETGTAGPQVFLPHSAVVAVLLEESGELRRFGFGPTRGA